MPPPPLSSTEAITKVADRLFTAIENGDRAEVDRMWSPDIAVWRVGARPGPRNARARRGGEWLGAAAASSVPVWVRRTWGLGGGAGAVTSTWGARCG